MTLMDHFEAASRPPRGQESCGCCSGTGEHVTEGHECYRCDSSGTVRKGSKEPYCDDQRQPRRRHWRQAAREYQTGHRPMEDAPEVHDITPMWPEDAYDHPEYYASSWPARDVAEGLSQLRRVRGQPDAPVTIFRASPADSPRKMHTGDWVSLSREYAQKTADSNGYHDEQAGHPWEIRRATVPARHVRDAGMDPYREHGYWGPDIDAEVDRPGHHTASDTSYRMMHEGPDPDHSEGLHEIGSGKIWPKDFHERPWDYRLGATDQSMDKVYSSKGWPSRKVWAYRALPSPHREVNPGDWVSTSKEYAMQEARWSNNRDDDYPVVKFQCRAEHLRNEGNSLDEWSYHGPPIQRALVHYSGGKNHRGKGPRGAGTDAYAHEHEPEEMYQAYEADSRAHRQRLREERQRRLGARQREGDERPYGDYTMRYRTEDMGERKPRHVIETFTPAKALVGELNWYGTTGVIHHINVADEMSTRERTSDGRMWGDGQDHRRKGIASAMWDWGQQMTPKPKHSGDRTPQGAEWAKAVRGPGLRSDQKARAAQEAFSQTFRSLGASEECADHPGEQAGGTDAAGHRVHYDPGDSWHHLDGSVSEEDGTCVTDHPVHTDDGHVREADGTIHEAAVHPYAAQDWYHGGYPDEFSGGSRGHWVHVGTKEAALQRIDPRQWDPPEEFPDLPHRRLYRVRLTPGLSVCPHMHSDEDMSDWHSMKPGCQHGRYDAMAYINEAEDKGSTSLVVHSSKIKSAEDLGRHPAWQDPDVKSYQGMPWRRQAALADHPEYGHRPERDWGEIQQLEEPHRARAVDEMLDEDHRWKAHIQRGLSLGHLSGEEAHGLGYYPSGHATESGTGRSLWQPLPEHMYHVTTDLAGVREHGLKTRSELAQMHGGHGLGGGEDDTISLTTSRQLGGHILGALHEFHKVVNGRFTPAQMWEQAKRGYGAQRPFHEDIASYWKSGWKDGDELPDGLRRAIEGTHRWNTMGTSQEEMDKHHPEYHARPAHDDEGWMSGHTPPQKMHAWWERDMSPDDRRENAADFYKHFAVNREHAGGPEDPMFFATDTKAFARKDPKQFALLHVRPRPGAQGYPLSAMKEWRTGTGDALEVHHYARQRAGELHEARFITVDEARAAARFYHGGPHPFEPGDVLTPEGAEAYGRNSRDPTALVSFTSEPWNAGKYADPEWHEHHDSPGYVHEVEPIGQVEHEKDMDLGDDYPEYNFRAPAARVVRRLDPEEYLSRHQLQQRQRHEAAFDWSGLTHGRYDVPTEAVYALRQHEQRASGKYPNLPEEVAESGIEQPLEVSLHDDGRVVLRGGSHRVNIAHDRGHPTVPVQIVDMRTQHEAGITGYAWSPASVHVAAGEPWFHGSDRPEHFDRFDLSKTRQTHEDEGRTEDRWWNSRLGQHFTTVHHVASGLAENSGAGWVYHAHLAVKNPKHYKSEFDLDRHGVEWGHQHGYDFGPYEAAFHQPEMLGIGFGSALREHPKTQEIADGFRRHLQEQGHDGITYGNEYEDPHHHLCAIAFHPDQVQVGHSHRCYEACDQHEQCPDCGSWVEKSDPYCGTCDKRVGSQPAFAQASLHKHVPFTVAPFRHLPVDFLRAADRGEDHLLPHTVKDVPLSKIRWANQDSVDAHMLQSYTADPPGPEERGYPEVLETPDGYHVNDGHTRIQAAYDRGEQTVKARVYHSPPGGWDYDSPRGDLDYKMGAVFVPTQRIFGPTTCLDKDLFDGDQLRPQVRDTLLARLDAALAPVLGTGWEDVASVHLAGSQVSMWTNEDCEGNGDLDTLIGIGYTHARNRIPEWARLTDRDIDKLLNAHLREHYNADHWHPAFAPPGREFDLTGYVNADALDIRSLKPYAAWDLLHDDWTVRPPELPAWSPESFPQGPALWQEARGLIAQVRAILRLPEPFRSQEARRIWAYIHEGRRADFSEEGLGWLGTGNVLEKALDQASGELVSKIKQLVYGPPDDHPQALGHGMTTADA